MAYALAGTIDIDLTSEPIARDPHGAAVFLGDLWPDAAEISRVIETSLDADLFAARAGDIFGDDRRWTAAGDGGSEVPHWDPESTYIVEPPFCADVPADPLPLGDIAGARCLLFLGDAVTTDHISPAGAIDPTGPAGRYLSGRGVSPEQFSVLGARRGNHEVMVRGTFANPRLRNRLVAGREGGWTVHHPSGEVMAVFDAAERYRREGTPLIIVAGAEYGAGSSRDWAAKGTALLGVRTVVAESFERLHRQNLIAMGVLPLQFAPRQGRQPGGIDGTETYDVEGLTAGLEPGGTVTLVATSADGVELHFPVTVRLDSPTEVTYYRHGGIVPYVLRRLQQEAAGQLA